MLGAKTIGVILFLVALRLASVLGIEPNNGPDEVGHMLIVAETSQGHWVTLESARRTNTTYPYAIYCPVPYLPGAIGMAIGAALDPRVNELKPGMKHFIHKAVTFARLGMLFWFGMYLLFLVLLTRELPEDLRLAALGVLGMLPQLTFVQSYVNLDSMGVAIYAYMVWALWRQRDGHTAFAIVLTIWSKMNLFCILPLPVLVLAGRYAPTGQQSRSLRAWSGVFRVLLLLVALPIAVGSSWFFLNYWVNTRPYGSWLGFSALPTLVPGIRGGSKVFTMFFFKHSIMSAFGYFGWMDQRMPFLFRVPWVFGILVPGTALLFKASLLSKESLRIRAWHVGFATVFCANFFLHYFASYTGGFQPQGRYLLPAVLTASGYLIHGLAQLRSSWRFRLSTGVTVFMILAGIWGVELSHENYVPSRAFPADAQANG